MAKVEGSSFIADFANPEAFYASGAQDKVRKDLAAATTSMHNLTEMLSLFTNNGYHLDAEASNFLVTELVQAVFTVSKTGLL